MTNKQKILSREREVAYHEGYERSREEMSRQSETHRILTIPASQSLTSREINGRMEKIPERYVIIDRKKEEAPSRFDSGRGFYEQLLVEALGKDPSKEGQFAGENIMIEYDDGTTEFIDISYGPEKDEDGNNWAAYGVRKNGGWSDFWPE